MFSSGNETFDKFLGGGFLKSTVNLFERQGPSSRILDIILNKSIASAALTKKKNILFINCNTVAKVTSDDILSGLPALRQVKSEVLYKDLRGASATAKIKIAWRYYQRGISSPSDAIHRVQQVDFGLSLKKEADPHDLGSLEVIQINPEDDIKILLNALESAIAKLKSIGSSVIVILKDLLHPFSPFFDNQRGLLRILYALRCVARRLDDGAIMLCYDIDMCPDHESIKEQIYNLVDCVISFHSYETDENKITGYKDADGTISYVKVPKINSYGLHFQQELSDWGYRLTKNHRYFMVDELSLPPCEDDNGDNQMNCRPKTQTELVKIENIMKPLEQASPLEEFREVARDILSRKLS